MSAGEAGARVREIVRAMAEGLDDRFDLLAGEFRVRVEPVPQGHQLGDIYRTVHPPQCTLPWPRSCWVSARPPGTRDACPTSASGQFCGAAVAAAGWVGGNRTQTRLCPIRMNLISGNPKSTTTFRIILQSHFVVVWVRIWARNAGPKMKTFGLNTVCRTRPVRETSALTRTGQPSPPLPSSNHGQTRIDIDIRIHGLYLPSKRITNMCSDNEQRKRRGGLARNQAAAETRSATILSIFHEKEERA